MGWVARKPVILFRPYFFFEASELGMISRTIMSFVVAAPMLVAPPALAQQAVEPRISALEAQIRELTGKIEELNFQILQMQDQMNRMQKDNEFRFQQLEGGDTAAPAANGNGNGDSRSELEAPEERLNAQSGTAGGRDVATAPELSSSGDAELGTPPRTFGTITFDADGNVVGGGNGAPGDPVNLLDESTQVGATDRASDNTQVASLPETDDPETLYRNSYEFILSGDYKTAESGFREHIKRFPQGEHAADANFWLGESLLGQDRYRDAAEVFIRANREYPNAKKAPDMLLKLGISLAAMNQRDVACATYSEIGERYPDISAALQERVNQEEALAGC